MDKDELIKWCKKQRDWCFDHNRKMEWGAWEAVVEKLEDDGKEKKK